MKRTVPFIIMPALLFALFFIYGCPVGIEYPPDKPGTVKIDKALLGTWTCVMDTCSDLQVVKVEKNDDFSYSIEVLEKSDSYLAEDIFFKGYLTRIDGKNFLYAWGDTSGKYYIYYYEVSGKRLSLYDVGLLVGGKDAVTSTEAFRAEISASLKLEGCLKDKIDFKNN